ncbi:hypothetical protein F1559_000701 [Cyanidiococcus yangmingshanensis]|uniref:PD-(D/E)XK endonuclease-like domain-containing protein n=1 Tax=Cyanidiococcus yangmingshanensis TaxID=2690220 RepID=A0A7J7IDT4_9RHOD|nr:hypothetical protein F1559_000701 [Cyanidiococcus yangmingshanensis]
MALSLWVVGPALPCRPARRGISTWPRPGYVLVEPTHRALDVAQTSSRFEIDRWRRRESYLCLSGGEQLHQLTRIRLYPSDLSYRWSGCRFCFWLKCKYGVAMRPPFPEVFNHIDTAMKETYHGKALRAVANVPDDWPDGTIDCSAAVEQVRSQEFQLAMHSWVRFTITGRLDALVRFTDETLGVIDFKVSRLEATKLHETYAMQLQAYAFALEHPALSADDVLDGPPGLGRPAVPRLALIAFRPERFEIQGRHHESHLRGHTELIPIKRDDEGFYRLLEEIAEIFESSEPPPPSESCTTCNFYAARYPFQS